MTLDLLSHAGTLHTQAQFDSFPYPLLRRLVSEWEKLFHAMVARQLDQLSLSSHRVLRIVPIARHRVLRGSKRVRCLLLVPGLVRYAFGEDRCRRVPCEEDLQARRQRLRQSDIVRRLHRRGREWCAGLVSALNVPSTSELGITPSKVQMF